MLGEHQQEIIPANYCFYIYHCTEYQLLIIVVLSCSETCFLLLFVWLLKVLLSVVCSFDKASNASGKFGGVAGVFVGAVT